jgi:Putative transposase
MTLATDEFIRRFVLHILPKGFHRIRHYGLFASTVRAANLARLRELLAVTPPAKEAASPSEAAPAETDLPPCPCCGGRMTVIEFFERGTLPRHRPFSAAATWFDTS